MTKSGRGALALVILWNLTASAMPAFAEDMPSRYYSISMGGISSSSYSAGEFADISASVEFAKGKTFNPALTMRWLVPVNPISFTGSLVGLGIDLTLFYLQDHPLARMSPRKTALAPLLGFAAHLPVTNPTNPLYTVSLSPFRLFAGYGYFSVGAFSIVLNDSFAVDGWGLKIFEFSYLVY